MDKRTIISISQKYLNIVSRKYDIEKAFLFGSFAKRKNNEDSDIDIALVFRNLDDFFKIQFELMRIRRKIDLRIEPHLFSKDEFNKNNPLANEIIKTGIELKNTSS